MSRAAVAEVALPQRDGSLLRYAPAEPRAWPRPQAPLQSRSFLAAVHVVCDPLQEPDGSGRARIDWDATLAFREHVWSWGLGVAEAMDTAQRGMGLGWTATQELIRRTAAAAVGRRLACGAGTDQLGDRARSLNAVLEAYLEQCALVEDAGAQPVVMASRALAALATTPDDYRAVYDCVLGAAGRPVILHWLGDMFDPALAGARGEPASPPVPSTRWWS